jgi:acetyl-CoA C-acetyltransferase
MDAFVYDHVRSPRGKGRADGGLHTVTPARLATQVLDALRVRSQLETALVGDVIFGIVSPVGEQGANLARIAALNAGYHQEVPGFQVNRYCASGLEAVNLAAARVHAGELDAVIAGGVESMSRVPIFSDGGACYSDPAVQWDTWYIPQGIGADLIATMDGYSREDLDDFALTSQRRAAEAWAAGRFAQAVIPVRNALGEVILDRDEHIRPDATMESLGALSPAFARMGAQDGFDAVMLQRYPEVERIEHRHTAGNSSGIVDGAAGVLIGSAEFGKAAGLKPRARIVGAASIGSEPAIMLTGPSEAARRLLKRKGMSLGDIDLFEINEAFASVVLRFMRDLDVPHDKVNVAGGAIAMGHPLGATGAMLVGTVLDELEARGLGAGLISLCAAAGMAGAMIIERV